MTYLFVLIVFVGLPALGLAFWAKRSGLLSGERGRLAGRVVAGHILLALIYTTPWDNYLVATRVWWYDPALVTGLTIGWVPLEEYGFFVLQTLMTGMWTLVCLRWSGEPLAGSPERPRLRWGWFAGLAAAWLGVWALLLWGGEPFRYLTLILTWALVPLLLQAAFGADILATYWRALVPAVGIPTVYLWGVDALAISSGTWTISPSQTLGWGLGVLPLEEMTFFLVTNMLVGLGVTLMLAPASQQRAAALLARWRASRGAE